MSDKLETTISKYLDCGINFVQKWKSEVLKLKIKQTEENRRLNLYRKCYQKMRQINNAAWSGTTKSNHNLPLLFCGSEEQQNGLLHYAHDGHTHDKKRESLKKVFI